MDNALYTTLTRQSGLKRELQAIANNVANISTTGFRKEGVIFAEYIKAVADDQGSLSMASGNVRHIDLSQGTLSQTNGTFDLAIEGPGFFLIETADGEALTRAGAFSTNADGELVTMDGNRLLDGGGAPIFVPPDASSVAVARDGTLSADGQPQAQIGLFLPAEANDLIHRDGVLFTSEAGVVPTEEASIIQGFLEGSNVNAITEIARMIEVQHAYQAGKTFIEREDERIRSVMQTLGKS